MLECGWVTSSSEALRVGRCLGQLSLAPCQVVECSSGAYSLLSQVQSRTFSMTTGGRPNRNRWVGKDVCEYRWWRWHKPSCRGALGTAEQCFIKLTFLAVAWAGNLSVSTVKCILTLADRQEGVQERRTGLTVRCWVLLMNEQGISAWFGWPCPTFYGETCKSLLSIEDSKWDIIVGRRGGEIQNKW